MNQNEDYQPEIKISDTKEMSCPCGSNLFLSAVSMRQVPAHLAPTRKVEYIPASVVICLRCQKPFERPLIEEPPKGFVLP